jgi:glycogen debranching enzyme
MVAIRALLAAGQYDRARQELEFILQYQDQKTGMIWHELSQSAGWVDWGKYPYKYLHVDLIFDFLNTADNYFSVTGDQDFAKAHWPSIQSAYQIADPYWIQKTACRLFRLINKVEESKMHSAMNWRCL